MGKTLLFDFDGTLFNSLPAVGGAILKMLKEIGRTETYTLEDMRKCVGPPLEYSFATFFGIPEEEIPGCIEIYRKHHTAMYDLYAPYDGIVDALKTLREAGFSTAVATSKWETSANRMVLSHGMTDCFDLIAGAAEGRTAGKSEVVKYVIDSLSLKSDDALMVGDRMYDVEGAAAFGIPTLGVLWGFGSREELDGAGAVGCAETPPDMVKFIRKYFE